MSSNHGGPSGLASLQGSPVPYRLFRLAAALLLVAPEAAHLVAGKLGYHVFYLLDGRVLAVFATILLAAIGYPLLRRPHWMLLPLTAGVLLTYGTGLYFTFAYSGPYSGATAHPVSYYLLSGLLLLADEMSQLAAAVLSPQGSAQFSWARLPGAAIAWLVLVYWAWALLDVAGWRLPGGFPLLVGIPMGAVYVTLVGLRQRNRGPN